MSKPTNEEQMRLLLRLEKTLVRAGERLMGPETPESDIDDAFVDVLFVWLVFRYILKEKYGKDLPLRKMAQSAKFQRLWPQICQRMDEVFLDNNRN